ncbi:hypothetical protein Pan44_55080 [Caulifigura coniformis]|uniref:Uncharacterized protein n=1 Tax=Caulifigura coniformis TaxID=2527983 RepID=A0A517SMT7_9PLAN|nr:hypothetical protein [Caulifigura coniformis]QDT57439.1 hypothetical protein Pan44_55080 [Caulifigura coniformis]
MSCNDVRGGVASGRKLSSNFRFLLALVLCASGCPQESPNQPAANTFVSISWKIRVPVATVNARPPVSVVFRDMAANESEIKIYAPTGTVDPTDSNYMIYQATGTQLKQGHSYTVLILDDDAAVSQSVPHLIYAITTGQGGNLIVADELQNVKLWEGVADLGDVE